MLDGGGLFKVVRRVAETRLVEVVEGGVFIECLLGFDWVYVVGS
jgi:hypothetical protein